MISIVYSTFNTKTCYGYKMNSVRKQKEPGSQPFSYYVTFLHRMISSKLGGYFTSSFGLNIKEKKIVENIVLEFGQSDGIIKQCLSQVVFNMKGVSK